MATAIARVSTGWRMRALARSGAAAGPTIDQGSTVAKTQRETLEFRFRFRLAGETAPGQYPWPVQVSMGGA